MAIRNIIEKAEKQFPVDQNITNAINEAVSNITGGGVVSLPDTIVYTTGSQTISGEKTFSASLYKFSGANVVFVDNTGIVSGEWQFSNRPTVNSTPVMVSGDPTDLIHLYGKNNEGKTIYKGQPVYIESAAGANPLIKLASNLGERTSSKTIGLLAQNLTTGQHGYIVTQGILDKISGDPFGSTALGSAGDPIWLGQTGNLIFGTGYVPSAPLHHVYLGVVLRSQNNNNTFYVSVQNGAEMDELHNVVAKTPSDKDSLLYNSASGLWFSRQITTGDISGADEFVTISSDQTISGSKTFESSEYIFSGANVTFLDGIVNFEATEYVYSGAKVAITGNNSSFKIDVDNTETVGVVKNISGASGIYVLSQAEYDALLVTGANTVYIII